MNCFRCGRENGQDSAFCIFCGAPLTSSEPQNAAPPKKKRGVLFDGIIFVGVLAIIAAVYFLFFATPDIRGLWVCKDRGWALRFDDLVTEYSPAGIDQTAYTYRNGWGGMRLAGVQARFDVNGDEMTLTDLETGDKYLFVREDDADVEAVVTEGLLGLWGSNDLGRVIELKENGKLTLLSVLGEAVGAFRFDLNEGSGSITLDGAEYRFTAGWYKITVEGMGGFARMDSSLDVAAYVRRPGTIDLKGTWYDTEGNYGLITFREDGTYRMALYGKVAGGTYAFDTVTGEGFIEPDSGGRIYFNLLDGRLALGEATYTRQYVEQPGAEDYYAAIAGSWVAVKDHKLMLEFAGDGTVIFHSGSDSARGTFTFNPVDRTGSISLTETEHYPFRLAENTLYVDGYPYVRADAVNTPERDPDSLLGLWYDEAGQAGTLYFDENGAVTMETHGVVYSGTYTFNKAAGSGKMVVEVDGEDVTISIYLLYGKLYTDDTVYTQKYVEQAP